MIIEAIIIAAGLIISSVIFSNTIENLACELAEDFFSRWADMRSHDDDDDEEKIH